MAAKTGTTDTKEIVAVIDIGSSAIRMVIAELGTRNDFNYLENLQKPIKFGKDVFTTGRLSKAVMREGIQILKDFKHVALSYGAGRIQAIATSAVREAQNRDGFVDQAYLRTGLDVEIIEGPEENRLELIAVDHALGDTSALLEKGGLIVEVGSGSTEMIVLNEGRVEHSRTLSIGSIRLPEQSVAGKTDEATMRRTLKRSIHQVVMRAAQDCALDQTAVFIALGAEMRFVYRQLTEQASNRYGIVDKPTFVSFVGKLAKATPEEIVERYGIPYTEAETLFATLLFYEHFLGETKADRIIIPMTSIRDALLLELAQLFSGYKKTDLSKQVLNSARHMAQRFHYDKSHASCVASLALQLFDLLQEEHGMAPRERLLLEAAAILHDIGTYIAPNGHHKHSAYLIDATDIFGLRKSDKQIVSGVVRYHRKSGPRVSHPQYMSLSKIDRAVVSKLSALLRVADSLDASHRQTLKRIVLERWKEHYILWVSQEAGDISMERKKLEVKGDLFAEVFGAQIMLRQGSPASP